MVEEEGLVRQIHAAPSRIVLAVAGGGSEAIGALLRVAGASQTVQEALAPYSAESLTRFLGAAPEQSCSPGAARAMAMTAFLRCRELTGVGSGEHGGSPSGVESLFGVACTASLASLAPKRGRHRAHVAVQSARFTETVSLELTKGARSRGEEERLAARLILNRVAAASGVADRLELDLLARERVEEERTEAEGSWRDLILGEVPAVRARGPLAAAGPASGARPKVVFPGAFNPLHRAHRRMAQAAAERLGAPVHFEIAILNFDKPPLDYTEIAGRLGQFEPDQFVWLSRSAAFVDKSRLFPEAVFVVGVDTVVRIANRRYHGGDDALCRQAIGRIAQRGCRFLVFGRETEGGFQTLRDVELPQELRSICDGVPEELFREDVSSTQLRRRSAELR